MAKVGVGSNNHLIKTKFKKSKKQKFMKKSTSIFIGILLLAVLAINFKSGDKYDENSMFSLDLQVQKASADSEFYCDGSGDCTGMSMIYMPCVYIIWEEYAECVITYDEFDICNAFEQSDC